MRTLRRQIFHPLHSVYVQNVSGHLRINRSLDKRAAWIIRTGDFIPPSPWQTTHSFNNPSRESYHSHLSMAASDGSRHPYHYLPSLWRWLWMISELSVCVDEFSSSMPVCDFLTFGFKLRMEYRTRQGEGRRGWWRTSEWEYTRVKPGVHVLTLVCQPP